MGPPCTLGDEIREVCEIKVIRVRFVRGQGTDKDPVRYVCQYWSPTGELLAETDTLIDCAETEWQNRRSESQKSILPHCDDRCTSAE